MTPVLIESRPALDAELCALVPGSPPDDGAAHFVAVLDGRAVACAAWRMLVDDGVAELVRLHVRPAFRGRGIARQLIVALEEEALAAGRPVVRVTTGSGPAALALFQSSGYAETPGGWYEKRLAALVQ